MNLLRNKKKMRKPKRQIQLGPSVPAGGKVHPESHITWPRAAAAQPPTPWVTQAKPYVLHLHTVNHRGQYPGPGASKVSEGKLFYSWSPFLPTGCYGPLQLESMPQLLPSLNTLLLFLMLSCSSTHMYIHHSLYRRLIKSIPEHKKLPGSGGWASVKPQPHSAHWTRLPRPGSRRYSEESLRLSLAVRGKKRIPKSRKGMTFTSILMIWPSEGCI